MSPYVFEVTKEDLWDCDCAFYQKMLAWAEANNYRGMANAIKQAQEIIESCIIAIEPEEKRRLKGTNLLIGYYLMSHSDTDLQPVCDFMAKMYSRFAKEECKTTFRVQLQTMVPFLRRPSTIFSVLQEALNCLPDMWD
jgi:hypothetical protein